MTEQQQQLQQPTQEQPTGMSVGGDVSLAKKFLGFPEESPDDQLDNFLQSNPSAAARMGKYRQAMMNMGGMRMGAQAGTLATTTPAPAPVVMNPLAQQSANLVGQTMQPIQAQIAGIQPAPAEFIPVDAGMTVPMAPFAEAATTGTTQQAPMPLTTPTATMTPAFAAPQVQAATGALQPAQGTLSQQAQSKCCSTSYYFCNRYGGCSRCSNKSRRTNS